MLMTLATKAAHQYAFCNILVITNLKFASRKLEITMQKQKLESGLLYLIVMMPLSISATGC